MKFINKTLYKCIWGLCLALFVNSCSLDEYNPAAVSEDNTLNNFEGWKAYQSSCYGGLWNQLIGMNYGLVSEVGTDLWTFSSGRADAKQIIAYTEFTDSNSGHVIGTWNFAWGSIQSCNRTILLAESLIDGEADQIKVLVAEAKFLRAFYYSVVVAQFGEVPLVLTDEKNLSPTRNTYAELYGQMVQDLKDAFNDLPVKPFEENPARVTKKAALGILARVYAQGAGEGLTEDGKSYWVRAKETAESLIKGQGSYNAALYDDFAQVFASANNRNNAEVLFTAYGLDPYNQASFDVGKTGPNIYLHYYPKLDDSFGASVDLLKRGVNKQPLNAYYGRLNQQFVAPTKYLLDCFDAKYDKRWENTFVTAYTNYSIEQAIKGTFGVPTGEYANKDYTTYANATVTLTEAMCTKYGIHASHVGEKIYPYVDVLFKPTTSAGYQNVPKIWKKGVHSGDIAELVDVANANVHPYPLAADEDRFFAYLSKDYLSDAEKEARRYVTVNIDDLFDLSADATGSTYKSPVTTNGLPNKGTLSQLYPAMMKFNHNFDGAWALTSSATYQMKLGNIMIMRMAEVYLIAAEATLNSGGSGAEAAGYLNELRKRACRNTADFNTTTGMQLTTATIDVVLDEYARELCGEYNRWAILKRNKAFESRLQKYNKTAFSNFVPAKHYNRPIPAPFLKQINNAEEFGNNGY